MFYQILKNNISYLTWGKPHGIEATPTSLKVYSGEPTTPGDAAGIIINPSSSLGMGDSIVLISYLRELANTKQLKVSLYSSPSLINFYKEFLQQDNFNFMPYPPTLDEFSKHKIYLPALTVVLDHGRDRSWIDGKSLIRRLYEKTGMNYKGLPDWREFTSKEILDPPDGFYKNLNIVKGEKYILFQWHSSGASKNLPVKLNLKIITHLINKYKCKVYIIGRLKRLDILEKIPGVKNLSGKTPDPKSLISLAVGSKFIITPDSAALHIGEAYRVPYICILGGSLPAWYIADSYRYGKIIYGSGYCPHSPCGYFQKLPMDSSWPVRCPAVTGRNCKVLDNIELEYI